MRNKKAIGKLSTADCIVLILLPILTAFFALAIGRFPLSPATVWQTVLAKFGLAAATGQEQIIWSIRFPRIILAALAGAGLSAAGCAFQSLFSNPLATPDTLGVASGSSFGAALGILLGFGLVGIQMTALICGMLAVLLTWLAGSGRGRGMNSIVLAGIMIGSLFTALVSLVKFTADTESELPAITYWLMGSLNGKGYSVLKVGAPLILAGLIVLFLLRWRMNVLPLSEDEARATGTNIRALRAVTVVSATAMTAASVSMCGQVGWVGLLVPHMCRMRWGSNHLAIVPASISVGAAFMIIVDTAARSISAAEIPISVLTAIIGAPFFILLMRRSGGWQI